MNMDLMAGICDSSLSPWEGVKLDRKQRATTVPDVMSEQNAVSTGDSLRGTSARIEAQSTTRKTLSTASMKSLKPIKEVLRASVALRHARE